jgi:hypothetical protein
MDYGCDEKVSCCGTGDRHQQIRVHHNSYLALNGRCCLPNPTVFLVSDSADAFTWCWGNPPLQPTALPKNVKMQAALAQKGRIVITLVPLAEVLTGAGAKFIGSLDSSHGVHGAKFIGQRGLNLNCCL